MRSTFLKHCEDCSSVHPPYHYGHKNKYYAWAAKNMWSHSSNPKASWLPASHSIPVKWSFISPSLLRCFSTHTTTKPNPVSLSVQKTAGSITYNMGISGSVILFCTFSTDHTLRKLIFNANLTFSTLTADNPHALTGLTLQCSVWRHFLKAP